jgi:DNA-directed RNA polymerase specialized sigma subunit
MKIARCLPQSAALPRIDSALELFAADFEQAIEALTARLGHVPSESETAEWLRIDVTDSRQMLLQLQDRGDGALCPKGTAESGEEEVVDLPDRQENGPLFPRVAPGMQIPGYLPPAATSRPIAAAKLFAPDIERAVQTLTVRFGRAPTDSEVAAELCINLTGYRHVLSYLKDLEIGTFFIEGRGESGEEELAYLPNGPEEDPLFRCLRSEMQDLLTDAVRGLPEPERLVLTFYYSEEVGSKEISVILNSSEPTISQLRASASLHIRASLANSKISAGWKMRSPAEDVRNDLRSRQGSGSNLETSDTGAGAKEAEGAQVVVSGSQSGSVPTTLSRKLFGWRESWYRTFRSWYVISEEQKITQVRRQERHTRESGF